MEWKVEEKYYLRDVFDFTASDMNCNEITTGIEVVLSPKSKKHLSLQKNGDISVLKTGKTEITV